MTIQKEVPATANNEVSNTENNTVKILHTTCPEHGLTMRAVSELNADSSPMSVISEAYADSLQKAEGKSKEYNSFIFIAKVGKNVPLSHSRIDVEMTNQQPLNELQAFLLTQIMYADMYNSIEVEVFRTFEFTQNVTALEKKINSNLSADLLKMFDMVAETVNELQSAVKFSISPNVPLLQQSTAAERKVIADKEKADKEAEKLAAKEAKDAEKLAASVPVIADILKEGASEETKKRIDETTAPIMKVEPKEEAKPATKPAAPKSRRSTKK